MFHYPASVTQEEQRLGELAMRFRGTRDTTQRDEIAADYSETVDRLIASGQWSSAPAPEDQLPDEAMPEAFFDFWSRTKPAS